MAVRVAGTAVEDLTREDLERLCENDVQESTQLEYKRSLSLGTRGEKKKVLREVAAFANTDGGTIFFGIDEERDEDGQPTGIPEEICGLELDNPEKTELTLQHLLRDGLEPSLTQFALNRIESDQDLVLTVGIPRSIHRPHVVDLGGYDWIYRRAPGGKYRVDMRELRQVFLESANWKKEAEQFRRDRVEKITSGEIGPPLEFEAGLFFHMLPLARLDQRLDLPTGYENAVLPPGPRRGRRAHNLEGILDVGGDPPESHVQLFRNGGAELFVSAAYYGNAPAKPDVLASQLLERDLINYCGEFLRWLGVVDVEPPYIAFLTLDGVSGYKLASPRSQRGGLIEPDRRFDRDTVHALGVVLEPPIPEPEVAMRPVLDMMWQAGGWPESPYYDEEGQWTG